MNNIKLKQLCNVNWVCAARTLGCNHATLVGLIVNWWNSQDERHWALEGGPAIVKEKKRKQCDSVLCNAKGPVAVLEVEGSRIEYTLKNIGKCLTVPLDNFESLCVGILVVYGYEPKGRGVEREVSKIPIENLKRIGQDFTRNLKNKKLIIITADKKYDRNVYGIRSLNEYYRCTISRIEGIELSGGEVVEKEVFYKTRERFCVF